MRLIDADALKKLLQKQQIYGSVQDSPGRAKAILEVIHAPTVEAEPVLHGKLLEGKAFNDQHCSVCGQMFHDDIIFILPPDENGFHMPKRCPECGCYWDGGDENAAD